jgi:hypothetical protein
VLAYTTLKRQAHFLAPLAIGEKRGERATERRYGFFHWNENSGAAAGRDEVEISIYGGCEDRGSGPARFDQVDRKPFGIGEGKKKVKSGEFGAYAVSVSHPMNSVLDAEVMSQVAKCRFLGTPSEKNEMPM